MQTLYLTGEEQKSFDRLPAESRADFTVEIETLTFQDTPQRIAIRFDLFKPTDPDIIRFRDAAKKAKTDEEFSALAETLDLKKIGDAELTQLLFAVGPNFIGIVIADLLASVGDLELVAALSSLRHAMLESLYHYSPQEP